MNDKPLKDTLAQGLAQLNIQCDLATQQKLLDYLSLLAKWNKTHNLTAITNLSEMLTLHILDSLTVLPHITGQHVLDVGTGGGFPGMVLAIIDPARHYYLLDSLQKKISFLTHVAHKLNINNITVINHRVESYQYEQKFDVIVSRAFSSLQQMVKYSYHLAADNGIFVAMKGQYPEQEIKALPNDVKLINVIACEVPFLDAERHLVLLQKEKGS